MHIRNKRIVRGVAAIVVVYVTSTNTTRAISAGRTCHINAYESGTSTLRSTSTSHNGAAVQICTDAFGHIVEFNPVTAIVEQFGVCAFEIARDSGHPGSETSNLMAVSHGGCPTQSSGAYIRVSGISQGLYRILLEFAYHMASSPQNFDSDWFAPNRKGKVAEFAELRSGILAKNSDRSFKLTGIALSDPILARSSGYKLVFRNSKYGSGWVIVVDFTPEGLKALDFDKLRD